VEHWNAEFAIWHVSKSGNRFETLQPLTMGLTEIFGGVGPDVPKGLALRIDHGFQYLADHFLQQNRFWEITPTFAFVSEPQTNGVAEQFFRPLKERAIYGRISNNLEEVRAAVAAFVVTYNEDWRLKKWGF
jgi:transposase InsO family protein